MGRLPIGKKAMTDVERQRRRRARRTIENLGQELARAIKKKLAQTGLDITKLNEMVDQTAAELARKAKRARQSS